MATQLNSRRPIGQILLDGGFLQHHELERALEEQKHTNELLGQVLVRMGVLDQMDLNAALSLQGHLEKLEDAVRSVAGIRQMLGSLLMMTGKITSDQLDYALTEQKITGAKLGDILIRLGLISEQQLGSLLDFQKHQGDHAPAPSPLRLGEILVATGHISRRQLTDALQKQGLSQKKLGEVLIDEGYAHPSQVTRGIHLQQKLLRAVLVTVIGLAGVTMQGCGGGGGGGASSPATTTTQTASVVVKTNYLTVVRDDFGLIQPTFYYSTDNDEFWSIQANIAADVNDQNTRNVIRIDIPKTGSGTPVLNKTFSVEDNGTYGKFPGNFLVFNGQQSTNKKVEQGIVSFSPDSVMSDYVSGSFDVIMTDYDSAAIPTPKYRIKGIFSFKIGSYGPAA